MPPRIANPATTVQNAVLVQSSVGPVIISPVLLSPEFISPPEGRGNQELTTAHKVPSPQERAPNGYRPPYYPVQVLNGYTQADRRGALSQAAQIIDRRPIQFRRFVNMGYADVQIRNGLWNGVGKGIMFTPYPYGQTFTPHIPGQTRDNVAGFHKRGPSTYNIQDMLQSGPGSQPEHPGGPGQITGSQIYNPMSG